MSWRTVVISKSSKLDLRMNHLVVRQSHDTVKIHLGEIRTLIIESTQVSMTSALLSELAKQKIQVIFCDETHCPIAELGFFRGAHDSSKKILEQTSWSYWMKQQLWQLIVKEKIKNQIYVLELVGADEKSIQLLEKYKEEVDLYDVTNREGLAAKAYFSALFGDHFVRESETALNAALNYGYQLLLASFSREIRCCGYLPEIGIFHQNQHNPFNLASDLMEPFRPLVDEYVYAMNPTTFDTEEKRTLLQIFEERITIRGKQNLLPNVIAIYTKSIFKAFELENILEVKFFERCIDL